MTLNLDSSSNNFYILDKRFIQINLLHRITWDYFGVRNEIQEHCIQKNNKEARKFGWDKISQGTASAL